MNTVNEASSDTAKTAATFAVFRDSLITSLQKAGLSQDQVTTEFFGVALLMAASSCTGFGKLGSHQREELTEHFIDSLRRVVARSPQPEPLDSIEASHARVVRSLRKH